MHVYNRDAIIRETCATEVSKRYGELKRAWAERGYAVGFGIRVKGDDAGKPWVAVVGMDKFKNKRMYSYDVLLQNGITLNYCSINPIKYRDRRYKVHSEPEYILATVVEYLEQKLVGSDYSYLL